MISPSRSQAELIVSASESDANMLYATRFFAPDPFIYLRHRSRKILVMSDLELDRAKTQASVDEVLSLSAIERALKLKKRRVIDTAAVLLHLAKEKHVRSLLVPPDFPLSLADRLRRRGLRVVASSQKFLPERQFKSDSEIDEIKKSQKAAEAGVAAAIAMIRDSRISASNFLYHGNSKLTAEAVKERIATVALQHQCTASHTIVACGERSCDPHDEGSGPLRAHQPIVLDVFPRSQISGYWGDITRTVVRGRAKERLKLAFDTVLTAQTKALTKIKPGFPAARIHQEILDLFQERGFQTTTHNDRMQGFFHGTGHGVGLEIHELPRINLRNQEPLEPRHVVTVEPGLYYPGIGGVRLEDLVIVTATGIRNLTTLPKRLEL